MDNKFIAGKIEFISYDKGFGFIKPRDSQLESDCFFSRSDVANASLNFSELRKGDIVEFIPGRNNKPTERAKYSAKEIRLPFEAVAGAYTLKGRGHELNEDEFFVEKVLDGTRVVAAIADGLSNPKDTGWWASSEVMTYFVMALRESSLIKDRNPLKNNLKEREEQVRVLLNNVQAKFKESQKEMTDNRRQAKSTLIFFVSDSNFFICASAGDSYLMKADITGSNVRYQLGSSEERKSSIVQSAVGEKGPSWRPQVHSNMLKAKETLVLCSDGIIMNSLRRFLTSTLPNQKIAESLVNHSIETSGQDDATCILLTWKPQVFS